MSIEAGLCKYAELNDKIKQELRTKKKVTITAVNGQRYIGCALDAGKTIQVHGTPGNDMACYLMVARWRCLATARTQWATL